MKRVVLVRCGWMKHYAGGEEVPVGGGSYNQYEVGHERFNFKAVEGHYYGFVQTNRSEYGMNLRRIDPNAGVAETLDGVLVIFVSRIPKQGGQCVVGWYRSARVYGVWQPPFGQQREDCGYQLVCPVSQGVLLPVGERTWPVPSEKGGMRQTSVRYVYTEAGEYERLPWVELLIKRIDAYQAPSVGGGEVPLFTEAPSFGQASQGVPRLEKIQLERFKAAFKPEPIVLHSSGMNVLIGRNGSGKSTLLEALQWVDTALRTGARSACERYHGIIDLINLRSRTDVPYFRLSFEWSHPEWDTPICHDLKVIEKQSSPTIDSELLYPVLKGRIPHHSELIETDQPGRRRIIPSAQSQDSRTIPYVDTDKLALSTAAAVSVGEKRLILEGLQAFWSRAVFLRLSPNRLADGSLASRRASEPLLDEEGQTLPALLNELAGEQLQGLMASLQDILPDFQGVQLTNADRGRDVKVNYSLMERMPYKGRSGRSEFAIPSWMLSEGTRRLTAILALLVREPAPSLLCIEEIENGIDPWAVVTLLNHLQSAADRGIQVIVTTHSPWLLDHVPLESILQVRRVEGQTVYEPFESRQAIQAFHASIPPGTRYVRGE